MPYSSYNQDDDQDELMDSLLVDPGGTGATGASNLDYLTPEGPSYTPTDLASAKAGHDALEAQRGAKAAEYMQAATTEPAGESVGTKIGNFLGDSGMGILATLLDAGFNKGRAIPQIMTQTGQMVTDAAQRRAAEQDRALDFQLRAQQQRATNARLERAADQEAQYRQSLAKHWGAQEAQAQGRLDEAKASGEMSRRKFSLENDPNDPAVVDFKERQYQSGVPRGSLDNATMATLRLDPTFRGQVDLFFKEQGIPIEAQRAAATSGAGAQARLNVETSPGNVERQAAAQETINAAGARGSGTGAAQAQRAAAQEAGASKVLPGFKINNPQAYVDAAGDPTTFRKMQDMGSGVNTALNALRRMRELRAQYGTELIGDVKTQYDMAQAAVNTGMSQIGSSGTLGDKEREYYAGMIPSIGLGPTDLIRLAPGQEDPKLKQLDGAIQAFTRMGNDKMGLYGVSVDSGATPPATTPPGPASAPAPKPKPPNAAPAPAATSAAPPNASGMVHMRGPGGGTGWVKPEKVKAKIDAGYEVIP